MTHNGNRKIAPGLRFRSPFGFNSMIRRNPLGFGLELAHQFGDVVRFQLGPLWSAHQLTHPDHIKYVLQENNHNYWKGIAIGKTKVVIGEGLFTSEGDFWRRQRRLAQPAFHRQRIAGFATIMTTATASMLDRWHAHAATDQPLDVASEMTRLTLSVVGQALFSRDLTGEAAEVGRAMLVALEYVNHRVMTFIPMPLIVPTPRNWGFRKARRALDQVVYRIIDERRRNQTDDGDLLSMLLLARDADTGESMSDRQLRDEVMTFMVAGHETTAVTLAWTWYLLSQHPDVEERLRAEISTALGACTPTIDDLANLRYTKMVIEESMRLYPPVPYFSRQAFKDDEIGGYHIPANSGVLLSPFVTQRLPAWWENPEQFDPERFSPERSAGRPRYAYFPFSGGPRLCIGNEFALMEGQLVLAMVLQRFRLRLVPGHPVEPELRATLRPRHGVLMTLHEN